MASVAIFPSLRDSLLAATPRAAVEANVGVKRAHWKLIVIAPSLSNVTAPSTASASFNDEVSSDRRRAREIGVCLAFGARRFRVKV
jgi:hypothetical protein